MFVCICHAVTDKEIRRAIENGARGLSDLQDRLHVATCCGACAEQVEACLDAEFNDQVPNPEP